MEGDRKKDEKCVWMGETNSVVLRALAMIELDSQKSGKKQVSRSWKEKHKPMGKRRKRRERENLE